MTCAINADAEEIFVSPSATSGGDGSITNPLQSLLEAREAVRKINQDMKEDIYVYLRGGTYQLDDALELTTQDSGTNGYNVIWKSYQNEVAVISGAGNPITDWKIDENGIWYASAVGVNSRQLYVNGEKRTRAQTTEVPKKDILEVNGDFGYIVSNENYNDSEEVRKLLSIENISNVEFVYKNTFVHSRIGIDSVVNNESNGDSTITMTSGFKKLDEKTNLVWMENAYEFIDEAGEWCFDKENEIVYYKPYPDESIDNVTVIMPKAERLIYGKGKYGGTNNTYISSVIKNIVFENISFQYTTWTGFEDVGGYAAFQAGFNKNADFPYEHKNDRGLNYAVQFDMGRNIKIKNCEFSNLGCGAVRFGVGTKNSQIVNNSIWSCAGPGIHVEDHQRNWTDKEETMLIENIDIVDNTVHDIGTEYYSCVGIYTAHGRNIVIESNEVYNTPYTAISTGWGWNDNGTDEKYRTDVINRDNKIYKNLVHDCVQKLYDGGGIYNMSQQPGMEIQNNVVYNVGGIDGRAYYLDTGSMYINMYDNIAYNSRYKLFPKAKYTNIKGLYFDDENIPDAIFMQGENMLNEKTCVIEEPHYISDDKYPEDIIALAGPKKGKTGIVIIGNAKPGETIYYGLFNRAGVKETKDIYYINETTVGSDGKYSVELNYDFNAQSDYKLVASEGNPEAVEKKEKDIVIPEFYDIYKAEIIKDESTQKVKGAFSGRNSDYASVTIITAVYSVDEVLIGIENNTYSQYSNGFLDVDITKYGDVGTVKVMMWDGISTMVPLTTFYPIAYN